MPMILMNRKIRSKVPEGPAETEKKPGRGRPKGSRQQKSEPEIRHLEVLGVRADRYPNVPNELWNRIVALIGTFLSSLMTLLNGCYGGGIAEGLPTLVEETIPERILRFGCEVLEEILLVERGFLGSNLACPECGGNLKYQGDVPKGVKTRLGLVKTRRAYYHCDCGHSCAPLDTQLGLDGPHAVMPGLQRIIALLTATVSYPEATRILERLIPCKFSLRAVEEITATIASDVQRRQAKEVETILEDPGRAASRNGELEDWVAVASSDGGFVRVRDHADPTREFKLAAFGRLETPEPIFTAAPGEADRKVKLEDKSFVGHFWTAEEFYDSVNAEFFRRGFHRAKVFHCVGDGAAWVLPRLRLLGQENQELSVVLDWWHADERIAELARHLRDAGIVDEGWRATVRTALWEGELDDFFDHFKKVQAALEPGDARTEIEEDLNYFESRRDILRYKECRERGLPIGSGMIEGGIRFVAKDRLDCAGMSWNTSGGENILQLRCIKYSERWDEFSEASASDQKEAYRNAKTAWLKAA